MTIKTNKQTTKKQTHQNINLDVLKKIYLDFIYLKLWTTTESINHLTSQILLEIENF